MKSRCLLLFSMLLLALQNGIAQHALPELIADIEPKSRGLFTNAYLNVFFPGKDNLYFMTDQRDLTYGGELYKTDGTAQGTMRLTDIMAGPNSSLYMMGADVDGTFIFPSVPEMFNKGTRLWKTDGSPNGLQLIKELTAPNGDAMQINWIAEHNGKALYLAQTQAGGIYLSQTDGTINGTTLIKQIQLPVGYAPVSYGDNVVHSHGNYAYFKVSAQNTTTSVIGEQLWRTDGTQAGTIMLASDLKLFSSFTPVGNYVYFFAANFLWKTDGTPGGTTQVKEFVGWDSGFNNPRLYAFNDKVIASHFDTWISDGTPGGTVQISNHNVSWGYAVMNNKFYAIRQGNSSSSRVLFVMDGTPGGTSDVADLGENDGIFAMWEIPVVNNKLIVPFYDNEHKLAIGSSDGVSSTISLLADIEPATSGGAYFSQTVYKGKAYFMATDKSNGQEPWISDGTPGGTHMIREAANKSTDGADLAYRPYDVNGIKFGLANGTFLPDVYRLDENPLGSSLYLDGFQYSIIGATDNKLFLSDFGKITMTDGQTGEVVLKDYNSPNDARIYPPGFGVTRLGNNYVMELLIQGSASEQMGRELWVTNGTPGGSKVLKDINPGTADGIPGTDPLAKLSETLALFSGNEGTTGYELWKTDGTTSGTQQLKDIAPGATGSSPQNFFVDNNIVLFSADGGSGAELWKTDGTANGTVLVKDINPNGSSNPIHFTRLGNSIYFFAALETGWSLWKTDGTANGTVLIKTLNPTFDGNAPKSMITSNGLLWASAHSDLGYELLVSDGTVNGTNFIDIVEGPNSSNPVALVAVPGGIYFSANDQLWRSAGTKKFTTKIADQRSTHISNFGGKLYFTATSEKYGIEYFRLTPEKFDQEIIFESIQDVAQGVTSFNINATATSKLPVTFTVDGDEVTIAGNVGTVLKPGRVTIKATQAGNSAFNPTETTRTFCIQPPKPTLSFSNTNPAEPTLTSSIVSNGTWRLGETILDVLPVHTLIVKKAGSYTFATAIEGCHSAESQPYVVPLQDQVVTFTETDHNFAQGSFSLTATASSQHAVTFSVDNSKLTINGKVATIVAPGKVTITATQAGGDLFKPATKTATICIVPAKPLVTIQDQTLSSDWPTGNQWFLGVIPIAGATNQTFTATQNGDYTTRVTVDGCVGPLSNPITVTITGVEAELNDLRIYPNPVSELLHIEAGDAAQVVIINTLGQLIEERSFIGNTAINVSPYNRGVYFLKVKVNEKIGVRKFIKE